MTTNRNIDAYLQRKMQGTQVGEWAKKQREQQEKEKEQQATRAAQAQQKLESTLPAVYAKRVQNPQLYPFRSEKLDEMYQKTAYEAQKYTTDPLNFAYKTVSAYAETAFASNRLEGEDPLKAAQKQYEQAMRTLKWDASTRGMDYKQLTKALNSEKERLTKQQDYNLYKKLISQNSTKEKKAASMDKNYQAYVPEEMPEDALTEFAREKQSDIDRYIAMYRGLSNVYTRPGIGGLDMRLKREGLSPELAQEADSVGADAQTRAERAEMLGEYGAYMAERLEGLRGIGKKATEQEYNQYKNAKWEPQEEETYSVDWAREHPGKANEYADFYRNLNKVFWLNPPEEYKKILEELPQDEAERIRALPQSSMNMEEVANNIRSYGEKRANRLEELSGIYYDEESEAYQQYLKNKLRDTPEGAAAWLEESRGTEDEQRAKDNQWFVERREKYAQIPRAADYAQKKQPLSDTTNRLLWMDVPKDNTYTYINDINGYRDNVKNTVQTSGGGATPYDNYDYMTQEEIGTYNYLYATDPKEAQEYLKYLTYALDERRQKNDAQFMYDLSQKGVGGALFASGISLLESPIKGLGALDIAWQKLNREEESYAPINYNTAMQNAHIQSNAARQGVMDKYDWDIAGKDAFDFLYGTAMSTGESLLGSAYGPALNTIRYMSSAATEAIQEAHARGASDDQTLLTGIAAGAFEWVGEAIPFDHFFKMAGDASKKTVKSVIKNVLKQGMLEAPGEMVTEIGNMLSDWVINGDHSDLAQQYKYYSETLGLTTEQARRLVAKEAAEQVAEAGAGGFLQGGTMAGAAQLSSAANRTQGTNAAGAVFSPEMRTQLKELGESFGEDSKAGKLAKEYDAEKASAGKTGRLYRAILDETPGTKLKETLRDILTSDFERTLIARGEQSDKETVSRIAQSITEIVNDENASNEAIVNVARSKAAMDIVSEIIRDTQANKAQQNGESNAEAESTADETESTAVEAERNAAEAETIREAEKERSTEAERMQQNEEAQRQEAKPEQTEETDEQPEMPGTPQEEKNAELARREWKAEEEAALGEEEAFENAQEAGPEAHARQMEMRRAVADMGKGEAESVIKNDPGEGDATEYARGAKRIYNAALAGKTLEETNTLYGDLLTPETRLAVWQDGANELRAKQAKIKEKTRELAQKAGFRTIEEAKGNEAGVFYADVQRDITQDAGTAALEQMELIDQYAKEKGLQVRVYDSIEGKNGAYEPGTNIIKLSINPQYDALTKTMSHELYHFVEQFSQTDAQQIKRYVLDALRNQEGYDLNERVRSLRGAYGLETDAQAESEIVADGVLDVIGTQEGVNRLVKTNPSIAERVADWFKRTAQALKRIMGRIARINPETRALRKNVEFVETVRGMMETALETAKKNYETARTNLYTSQQGDAAVQTYVKDMRGAATEDDRTAAVNGLVSTLFARTQKAWIANNMEADMNEAVQRFADALREYGNEQKAVTTALEEAGFEAPSAQDTPALAYAGKQLVNTQQESVQYNTFDTTQTENQENRVEDTAVNDAFTESNNALRYSEKAFDPVKAVEDDAELAAQMQDRDVREEAELFNRLYTVTPRREGSWAGRYGRVSEVAEQVREETGTKLTKDTLMKYLRKIYAAMDKRADVGEVMMYARELGKKIIDNMPGMIVEESEEQKEARRIIRERKWYLTDDMKSEIREEFGSVSVYRRKNFGKIVARTKATSTSRGDYVSLAEVWTELNELMPGTFSLEATEADMPIILDAFLENAGNKRYSEAYGVNAQQYATQLGMDMLLGYFGAEQGMQSANEQAEQLRAKEDEITQKLKKDLQKKQQEIAQKYRQKLESRLQAQKERRESIETRKKLRKAIYKNVQDVNTRLVRESDTRHVPEELREAALQFMDIFTRDTSIFDKKALKRLQEVYALLREQADSRADAASAYDEDVERMIRELAETIGGRRLSELSNRELEAVRDVTGNLRKMIKEGNEIVVNGVRGRADLHAQQAMQETMFQSGLSQELIDDVTQYLFALQEPQWGFSAEQMEKLAQEYNALQGADKTTRKLYDKATYEKILEVSRTIGESVRTSDMTQEMLRSARELGDMLRKSLMRADVKAENVKEWMIKDKKPIYFFDNMGPEMKALFNDIRDGANVKYVDALKKVKTFFERMTEKYKVNDWYGNGERLRFETARGETIELTNGEALSMYALWKRETTNKSQNANHLRIGGFVYDDAGKIDGVDKSVAHAISESDMQKVRQYLGAEKMAYVDEMVEFLSKDMAELGNEVSRELYGYDKFREQYYYPYEVSHDFLPSDLTKVNVDEAVNNLKGWGSAKQLTKNASNPVVLGDFHKTWAGHTNKMGIYNAFTVPVDNINRVLNYQMRGSKNISPRSLKQEIKRVHGKPALNYIATLLRDIGGGVRADERTKIGKLVSLFKKNAVFLSASVAIQQPSAIIRAMALVNPKYFIGKPTNPLKSWRQMTQYAGVGVIKEMGRFDTGTGQSATEWITEGIRDEKWQNNLRKKAEKIAGFAPELMDELAWGVLWEAIKREVAAKTGLSMETEEGLREAGKRFNDVVDYTQVYDSVLSRSERMRSNSTFDKMITAFMAEATTSLNMLLSSLEHMGDQTFEGRVTVKRAAAAFTASVLVNAIAKSLISAFRRDDPDKTAIEKYLTEVYANFISDMNPLSLAPIGRDIVSIFDGYDVERSDLSVIQDLYDGYEALGKENMSAYQKIEKSAGAVAGLFGVPVKNVMRDVRTMYNMLVNSKPISETNMETVKYGILENTPFIWDDGNSAYYERMREALSRNDEKAYESLERYMTKSKGVSMDSVKAGVKKAIREAVAAGKITEDEAANMLEEHFDMEANKAWFKVQEWIEKAQNADDEDYQYNKYAQVMETVRTGGDATEAIKTLTDHGMTEKAVRSEIQTQIGEWYKAGEVTGEQAGSMLRKYTNTTDRNDIYYLLDRWEYAKENGSMEGYQKYGDFFEAVETGRNLRSVISEYTSHGVAKSTLAAQITSQYKQQYLALLKRDRVKATNLKARILTAYEALGYKRSDKLKDINAWEAQEKKKK